MSESRDRGAAVNGRRCPLSVTILAYLYMAVGAVGFAYHFTGFLARGPFPYDLVWAELIEVFAIVFGVFMLRGRNWARWGALAWIAFHVILSFFHAFGELAAHAVFFAVIAWILFRPGARRYFQPTADESVA